MVVFRVLVQHIRAITLNVLYKFMTYLTTIGR